MNKKWFASDMAFKIYSLLIAVFLWVFVIYDQNPDSTKLVRNIPITYSNLDSLERSGYTVLKEDDDPYVDFKIKGKRVSLGNLSKDNIRASVTFSDFREGEYNLSIDSKLPQNDMSVVGRNLETITVKIEKLIAKDFPVGIIYTGENTPGKLATARLKTDTVTAMGPESVMNKIESIKVALDYTTLSTLENGTVDIRVYDADGNDMTYNKNLRLSTGRIIWEQKIHNVKDLDIELAFSGTDIYIGEEIKITENAVKLSGEDIQDLDFDKVKTLPLTPQLTEKLKNGETIEVFLDLPENVKLLKQDENGIWSENDIASVKISGKLMQVKKITLTAGENLEITDTEADKTYSVSKFPLQVLLNYKDISPEALSSVKFKISAKNLTAGEHEVEITATLPDSVKMADKYTAKLLIQNN